MQFPGRLAAAIEVLADMDARHRPVSVSLREWGHAHRFAGSGDRAAIGNLAYDALRQRRSLAWRMGEETPRALVLGAASFLWGIDPDDLVAQFTASQHAPDPLTADELARLQTPDLSEAPDPIRADLPDWLLDEVRQTFDDDWAVEGHALAQRPPLDLRVNLLKTDLDKAERQASDLKAKRTRSAETALRIAPIEGQGRHPNVKASQLYQRGRLEIQDESSQICALLCGPQPQDQVLDFCAGGGGKTLALAALMGNRGQIYAHDSDKQRLAPIFDRLRRSGVRNVQTIEPSTSQLDHLKGRMNLVLVDAPCSGSGVWRRRPDAKWRLSADMLAERRSEQDKVLAEAAPFVRPGGKLVYATCSVLFSENQVRTQHFAARNPDFQPIDLAAVWKQVLKPDGPSPQFSSDGSLIMSPHLTQTDGFFVAAFQRRSEGH